MEAFISKQLNLSQADYDMIANAEDDDDDSEPKSKGGWRNKRRLLATRVYVRNSKLILDYAQLTDIVSDSGSQDNIFNLVIMDLCADLTPLDGEIITATGEEMGVIKFIGFVYFSV